MWVVGILIAIVVMLTSGSTVMTSGPWWDGSVTGSGTTASIGPLLISCGSAARLARTALAFLTPKFVLTACRVLHRPVVLQLTTLTNRLPLAPS